MRTLVRYGNRKMYYPAGRGYVGMDELMNWEPRSFRVIDHKTKNDITKGIILKVFALYPDRVTSELVAKHID